MCLGRGLGRGVGTEKKKPVRQRSTTVNGLSDGLIRSGTWVGESVKKRGTGGRTVNDYCCPSLHLWVCHQVGKIYTSYLRRVGAFSIFKPHTLVRIRSCFQFLFKTRLLSWSKVRGFSFLPGWVDRFMGQKDCALNEYSWKPVHYRPHRSFMDLRLLWWCQTRYLIFMLAAGCILKSAWSSTPSSRLCS